MSRVAGKPRPRRRKAEAATLRQTLAQKADLASWIEGPAEEVRLIPGPDIELARRGRGRDVDAAGGQPLEMLLAQRRIDEMDCAVPPVEALHDERDEDVVHVVHAIPEQDDVAVAQLLAGEVCWSPRGVHVQTLLLRHCPGSVDALANTVPVAADSRQRYRRSSNRPYVLSKTDLSYLG